MGDIIKSLRIFLDTQFVYIKILKLVQGITVGKSIFLKKINDKNFRFVVVGDKFQGFQGWGYLKFLYFVKNIEI